MTGCTAVSQCGHTPNRPGHHGTVVAKTVGSVAISCNAVESVVYVIYTRCYGTMLSNHEGYYINQRFRGVYVT